MANILLTLYVDKYNKRNIICQPPTNQTHTHTHTQVELNCMNKIKSYYKVGKLYNVHTNDR